jgi:predicted nuclease with TOPRIM domain
MKPQKYSHDFQGLFPFDDGEAYLCSDIDPLLAAKDAEILALKEAISAALDKDQATSVLKFRVEELKQRISELEAENMAWEEQLCLQSGRIVQLEAENARLKSEHYLPKSFIDNFGKETI